jgi:hypothetical protein
MITKERIEELTGFKVTDDCAAYVGACQTGSAFGEDTTYELVLEYQTDYFGGEKKPRWAEGKPAGEAPKFAVGDEVELTSTGESGTVKGHTIGGKPLIHFNDQQDADNLIQCESHKLIGR